jgi:hypothetical protein
MSGLREHVNNNGSVSSIGAISELHLRCNSLNSAHSNNSQRGNALNAGAFSNMFQNMIGRRNNLNGLQNSEIRLVN